MSEKNMTNSNVSRKAYVSRNRGNRDIPGNGYSLKDFSKNFAAFAYAPSSIYV